MNLGRCCARRRFGAAWEVPAKGGCSSMGLWAWKTGGTLCFKDGVQIVDFFHALEPAGHGLEAWIGKPPPD